MDDKLTSLTDGSPFFVISAGLRARGFENHYPRVRQRRDEYISILSFQIIDNY